MRSKLSKKKAKISLLSVLGKLLSVPVSFFGGLLVGLIAPLAAVAGIVGGVYLFTKKIPFFSQVEGEQAAGERSLILKLMPPDEAQAALVARQAELKKSWSKIREELVQITRQANEDPLAPESDGVEPQP